MHHTDQEYLEILQDYHAKNGLLPSYSVVAGLVGYRTSSGVTAMVKRLKQTGHLSSAAGGRLAPGKRFFERKAVDLLAPAGSPTPLQTSSVEPFEIDNYLVARPSRTVIWEVRGDSMINAGLLSGDRAVVELGGDYRTGKIVMARIDEELTVKTLAKAGKKYYLQPANDAYPDLHPRFSLEVIGPVVGSFRRFK